MYSYIHIPFCTSKCKYCRFASVGSFDAIRIQTYIEKLCADISQYDGEVQELSSVYFGGGTPSTLSSTQIQKILGLLKKKFSFKNNIEISFETTPENVTLESFQEWVGAGINRVSIGVQTTNPKALREIGRATKGDIISALDCIKDYSPLTLLNQREVSVSLDFIIGLPYVQVGEVEKDIEMLLGRYEYVNHVSVYMLEDYYEVDDKSDNRYENIVYPDTWGKLGIADEEYMGEYLEVQELLEERGFHKYEISNYAKDGYECRHNKAYWNHSDVVAFGLGAHGFQRGERYSYSENFQEYYGNTGIKREILSEDDILIEKIMFGMRTFGLELDIHTMLDMKKINEIIQMGLIEKNKDRISLTDKGIPLLDTIIKEITHEI